MSKRRSKTFGMTATTRCWFTASKQHLSTNDDIQRVDLVVCKSSSSVAVLFCKQKSFLQDRRGDKLITRQGAGRIYETLNLPCVPVALNTGKVWPKNSFLKYNHNIKISFLEPIEPGKDKNVFIDELEKKIYSSIDNLN